MTTWANNVAIFNRARIPLPALLGLDRSACAPRKNKPFFFASPLLSQQLALLNNMVGSRSFVIVVIGERGSGKTTLMNQFIADTGNRWQVCRIRLRPRRKIPVDQWRNLHNRMVFLSKKDSPPSVIVDDAHQLSSSELKVLLQSACSADGCRKLQSIVLFAEPCMRSRLTEITRWLPPKTVIDKIYMTPLTERQTAEYLQQRFKAAGILRESPFSHSQIRGIYEVSGGLPGWINGEAFMMLRKMYAGKSGFKKPFFKWWSLAGELWEKLFANRLFLAKN